MGCGREPHIKGQCQHLTVALEYCAMSHRKARAKEKDVVEKGKKPNEKWREVIVGMKEDKRAVEREASNP